MVRVNVFTVAPFSEVDVTVMVLAPTTSGMAALSVAEAVTTPFTLIVAKAF